MENLFWKFFLPNWSWARQPLSSARSTLLYPFQMLSAKQGSSNSHLLTSFGMTRPGFEPTTSRLWGGRSTDWANTHHHYCVKWVWSSFLSQETKYLLKNSLNDIPKYFVCFAMVRRWKFICINIRIKWNKSQTGYMPISKLCSSK